MRFSLVLLLAPVAMALMAEPVSPQLSDLMGRATAACKDTGCKCDTTHFRKKQGQFCGGCHWDDGTWVITKKRVQDHVYECNKNGGCCDYGYAKDCVKMDGNGRCGD